MSRLFHRQRQRPTLEEVEMRRAARADGLKSLLPVMGIILLVILFFLLTLIIFRPLRDLRRLEQDKASMQGRLEDARADHEKARNEFRWMSDPEYFENVARDRANLAKPGETILRQPEALPQKR